MPPGAGARVLVLGVPAFGIDAVQAEELEPAAFEMLAQRGHHLAVFPFVKPALGSWKNENPGSRMAEHQQLHVAAERGAVPAVVFTVHRGSAVRARCEAMKKRQDRGESYRAGPGGCSWQG